VPDIVNIYNNLAIYCKSCHSKEVKKILLALFFVVLFSLVVVPQGQQASAFTMCLQKNFPCSPGGIGLPCCKGLACPKAPATSPVGAVVTSVISVCGPSSGSSVGGIGGALPNPPAPPCAPNAMVKGKCTAVITAFGRVSTEPGQFITRLFAILLGGAGGIAVILIMRSGYRIMTARGNPEGIQQGREQFVAAIVGLMFLVFSFVLLQVIGIDILRIPNFTGGGGPATSGACSDNGGRCTSAQDCNQNGGRIIGSFNCTSGTNPVCCGAKMCSDYGGNCTLSTSCRKGTVGPSGVCGDNSGRVVCCRR
jgi:hypothetical protein